MRTGNRRLTADLPSAMAEAPRIPPRWFVRSAWVVHRAMYRLSRGRFGLWRPKPGRWGALRLLTTGRRSGRAGTAILGYFEDGPNYVTLAMNGWAAPEPDMSDGSRRAVRGRAAVGEERDRLWARWREHGDGLDGYATRRPSQTAVVVLEPLH